MGNPRVELQNPSLATVMEHIVGHWGGALLISVGLAISLLGALLSWALLCAEILFTTARDKTMPAFLQKENANHVPVNALWLTNVMIVVRMGGKLLLIDSSISES